MVSVGKAFLAVALAGLYAVGPNMLLAQSPSGSSSKITTVKQVEQLEETERNVQAESVDDRVLNALADRGNVEVLRIEHSGLITQAALARVAAIKGLASLTLIETSGFETAVGEAVAANPSIRTVIVDFCGTAPSQAVAAVLGASSIVELRLFDMAGIDDAALEACSERSKIEKLTLACGRGVTQRGVSSVAKLKSLHYLDFRSDRLGDEVGRFRSLTKLKTLRLQCSTLHGSFSGGLFDAMSLETLDLSFCPYLDLELLTLGGAGESLRILHLPGRSVTDDSSFSWLEGLPKLEELWIFGSMGLAGRWGPLVAKLPKLRTLSIPKSDVVDSDLAEIAKFAALDTLNLDHCKKITDAGLAFLGDTKSLSTLNIRMWPRESGITEAGVASFRAKKPDCLLGR